MTRTILTLAILSLAAFPGLTQTRRDVYYTCAYGPATAGYERCKNFQGDLAYSDDEAVAVVDRIRREVGLGAQRKIELIPCAGIGGALAGVVNGTRFIWYDNDFMENLNRSSNSDWASWSVLAHEVGHHIYTHTLTASDLEQSRKDELAADYFSGFVLAKLGANLAQAQAAANASPDVYDERNSRHPKRERRLAAIEQGFNDAVPPRPPSPNPDRGGMNNTGQFVIDAPQSGATVGIRTRVSGRTPYYGRNHYIVAISSVAQRYFIQQPVIVSPDGTWEGTAAFGTPAYGIGHQWAIFVFVTNSHYPVGELFRFPGDAIYSKEVIVTRTQ